MKIIEEPWINFYNNKETIALTLDKKEQYTISELILLLEEAKKRFGDKTVLFHNMNTNDIGGFSHIYLNPGYDKRDEYGGDCYEDDTICIYG